VTDADDCALIERVAHLERLGWAVEKHAARGEVEVHIADLRATADTMHNHARDNPDELNQQRIQEGRARMEHAGRLIYRLEASGDHTTRPSDIIRTAEQGTK
jgi:hypothetical protein